MELGEKQLLVAFGTNQPFGDTPPEEVISKAIHCLGNELGGQVRPSSLFKTPCFPAGAGPDYVNAAAIVTLGYAKTPQKVLEVMHLVEHRFGRERGARWASRTLDIDLLAQGTAVLPDCATQTLWRDLPLAEQALQTPDRLILPHPRLQDRAFVLVPLAEIAPDWRHPVTGLSVNAMVQALPAVEVAAVVRLNPAASD